MSDDAYDLALDAVEHQCAPTCIPIIDRDGKAAVAVVTLRPGSLADVALFSERQRIRARGAIAVARRARALMERRGYQCR